MNHTKIGTNDSAVSPVIGVLLMVSITVILAAIIGAFVFGMAPGMTKVNKMVGVTAQQPDGTHITVTYQGGQDAQNFEYGTLTVTNDDKSDEDVTYDNGDGTDNASFGNKVGSTVTATGTFSEKNHVIVTGHFTDGSEQVLLDTYV